VSALTAVYLDFQCPLSCRLWRCLSLTPERAAVDIRPYCMDAGAGDQGERRGPWERTEPTVGLELLALGELARDAGRRAHEAYVDAAFAAVHDEHRDLADADAWLHLGADAGLDLEAYTADSERWRAEVGLWHREAEDDLGVFTTPSLVFEEQVALFVRLEEDIASSEAASRLIAALAELVAHPVDQVHRTA
jgi:hypothetical protein